jgi:hypothetical protein
MPDDFSGFIVLDGDDSEAEIDDAEDKIVRLLTYFLIYIYLDALEYDQNTLNNYWMRLSMISRIIQTEVNVICRSEAEADNIGRGLNNS